MLEPYRKKLHYLEMNVTGEPRHPLYIATSSVPQPWIARGQA